MIDKKLSEVIAGYRTDRPDEWSMDIFIRGAEKLEAENAALKAKLERADEFKQGVYQYLRECQPHTKEEIELYEQFSYFIRGLDSTEGGDDG